MKRMTVALCGILVATLVQASPPTPTGLKAVPKASNRIDLSWNDVSGETGYQIQRRAVGGSTWATAGTVGANVTIFSDNFAFDARKKYEFQVIAFDGGGSSVPSTTTWSVAVFTGPPFSDWINVADYGANGQDAIDDTAAFQSALNVLNLPGVTGINDRLNPYFPHVLFVPNGTYRISETLFLEGRLGLLVQGESAGNVILEWEGNSGPSAANPKAMFHSDGVTASVFRNLVWDGGSDRGKQFIVAFDESYCGNGANYNSACTGLGNASALGSNGWNLHDNIGYADIGTMHIDSTFQNAWIGLRIGHYHVQDSEMTIRRCQFLSNDFGASIEDFNALDIWFWDCRFEGNREVGVTNAMMNQGGDPTSKAGDFRIIRGRFVNNCSVTSNSNCANFASGPATPYYGGGDVTMSPDGHVTIQDSWSKGSARFVVVNLAGLTGAVHGLSLIKNKIDAFDQQNAYSGRAVVVNSPGPLFMLGNEVDTSTGGGPRNQPIHAETWTKTGVVALHNKFTTAQPYSGTGQVLFANDDATIGTFDLTVPSQPSVNAVLNRPVYTVTDAANAQDVIGAAIADANAAIVHFPSGFYSLSSSLTVPSGQDLTLMGNGQNTQLFWAGGANGTVLDVDGYQPNGLTIRDLQLGSSSVASDRPVALKIRDFNQDGTRLYVSKVSAGKGTAGAAYSAISLDGTPRPSVDLIDVQSTVFVTDAPTDVGVRVVAGPQNPQPMFPSGLWMWTGMLIGHEFNSQVVNGPNGVRMLLSNTYSEGSQRDLLASGGGSGGDVCLVNGKTVGVGSTATDLIRLDDFGGNVSIIQKFMPDEDAANEGVRVEQSGAASVQVQMIGNMVYWDPEYCTLPNCVPNPPSNLVRVGERYFCGGPSKNPNLGTCDLGANPGIDTIPLSDVGNFPADNSKLDTGINLIRNYSPPGHYDEPETAPHQLNIDNVSIGYVTTGIQVMGGIPLAPTTLSVSLNAAYEPILQWTDTSSDEDSFEVGRATSSTGPFTVIATLAVNSTSYTDGSASMGVTYYYRVNSSRTRTGDSGFTNVASVGVPSAGDLLAETFQGSQSGYDLSGWAEAGSAAGATINPNATDNPPVPGNGFFGEALRAQVTTNGRNRRTEHNVTSTAAVCAHARLYVSQAGLANGQSSAILGLLKNTGSLGASGQPASLLLTRNASGQLQLAMTVRNTVVATTNISANTNYGVKLTVNDTANTWSFALATGAGGYSTIGSGSADPTASTAKIGLGTGTTSTMNQPTTILFDKVEVYSTSCP